MPVCYYYDLDWMRAPFPVPAGVVLRSLIGAQILVCKISPLVTVSVSVTNMCFYVLAKIFSIKTKYDILINYMFTDLRITSESEFDT